MTLPSSGIMAADMVNTELARTSTAFFDMNASSERKLAGKATANSAISMADFYGKTNTYMTSGNGQNVNAAFMRGFGLQNALNTNVPTFTYGSLTPSATTINGATIRMLSDYDEGTASYFYVILAGTRVKTFFTSITINGSTLTTASATFGAVSGGTYWRWSPDLNIYVVDPTIYPFTYT